MSSEFECDMINISVSTKVKVYPQAQSSTVKVSKIDVIIFLFNVIELTKLFLKMDKRSFVI